MKTERIRNTTKKSRITSLDPPPTVEIKGATPTVEIKGATPTVEIRNKFMLDPHGGNMYKQNQQRR